MMRTLRDAAIMVLIVSSIGVMLWPKILIKLGDQADMTQVAVSYVPLTGVGR